MNLGSVNDRRCLAMPVNVFNIRLHATDALWILGRPIRWDEHDVSVSLRDNIFRDATEQ